MRRIHLALMLFAALVMGMAGALTWLATSAATGPRLIGVALAPALPARSDPPTSDSNFVVEASPADDRCAAGASDPMTPPIGAATQSDAHPAVGIGVLVVDAAGVPQPEVPVALCTTERLTGRPCTLPLGKTGSDGILALPPHRLGTLVAETPGGRIGTVERTAVVPHDSNLLHEAGNLGTQKRDVLLVDFRLSADELETVERLRAEFGAAATD